MPEKTTTSPELTERFTTANNDGGLRAKVRFTTDRTYREMSEKDERGRRRRPPPELRRRRRRPERRRWRDRICANEIGRVGKVNENENDT
ncbi:hypothetical protein A2U01_0014603 [Trifolium medium]|uniref:Uncharacterized protein n=1 Tax=Trifolium medium TaxID=97028 RepID=A0A392N1Q1_9FABA|nr:hypothetical protein [Trifolium medium]